ncbi:methyltransferase domain-containing protein [Altererythrobacter ishigakiensis]|uniref:methyltransferase domain-containing protein n=1 Tax=Altererythrobacter ishigakiensis TaxID=476157 RepID=UPI00316ACEFB
MATLRLGGLVLEKQKFCSACSKPIVGFFRYGGVREWGCPLCQASPRERLVNFLLSKGQLSIPKGASVLHVAPGEPSLVDRFRAKSTNYIPADLSPELYPVPSIKRIDLMEPFGIEEFDIFYASHVLEHVPDDAIVLANIFNALKPGGEAWLIVPLWEKPTEDGDLGMPPKVREELFGQWDHVRQYGRDIVSRLRAAGFDVELFESSDLGDQDIGRFGLGETLFRATRPCS